MKALVLGATGGMGFALVQEWVSRGFDVVAFSRSKHKLEKLYVDNPQITIVVGDALNSEDVTQAVSGVDIIFHAVSFPYEEWEEKHLTCLDTVIQAAEIHHKKLVFTDNIYVYGKNQGEKVTENSPKMPHTKKGNIRLMMENRIKKSNIPWLIGHLPDSYGPNAENTILYETLKNVCLNKVANYVGDKKIKREFLYTRDGAKALVELALREDTFNQHWNIPSSFPISGEEIHQLLQKEFGYTKSFRMVNKSMIRMMGIFHPFMKEMVEMMYLNENPILLNGVKYEQTIGPVPNTAYNVGIAETLNWIKNNKV